MTRHTVTICRSCPAGFAGLAVEMRAAFAEAGVENIHIEETDCMSGCTRPSTVAFRAPGKTAYLFGELAKSDIDALVNFARLYVASPDGNFADARPLGQLRYKALARIPASS